MKAIAPPQPTPTLRKRRIASAKSWDLGRRAILWLSEGRSLKVFQANPRFSINSKQANNCTGLKNKENHE
jgi:hypothetical protein